MQMMAPNEMFTKKKSNCHFRSGKTETETRTENARIDSRATVYAPTGNSIKINVCAHSTHARARTRCDLFFWMEILVFMGSTVIATDANKSFRLTPTRSGPFRFQKLNNNNNEPLMNVHRTRRAISLFERHNNQNARSIFHSPA